MNVVKIVHVVNVIGDWGVGFAPGACALPTELSAAGAARRIFHRQGNAHVLGEPMHPLPDILRKHQTVACSLALACEAQLPQPRADAAGS